MKENSIYINGLRPPLKWAGGKKVLVPHPETFIGLAVAPGLMPA